MANRVMNILLQQRHFNAKICMMALSKNEFRSSTVCYRIKFMVFGIKYFQILAPNNLTRLRTYKEIFKAWLCRVSIVEFQRLNVALEPIA